MYLDSNIKRQSEWQAINYFIEMNMLVLLKERTVFDEYWLHHFGNIPAFWAMVKKHQPFEYWKKVIDWMFSNKWFLKNRCSEIKDILYAENKYSKVDVDEIKPKKKKIDWMDIDRECDTRIGAGSRYDKWNPDLDEYFDYDLKGFEGKIPKKEVVKRFHNENDHRFKKWIEKYLGFMPSWE